VGGDCLIVGGFGSWEVFLVDEFVPCLVYGLCCCCYEFGMLVVLVWWLGLIGSILVWGGVGVCTRRVVLRVPLLR